MGQNYGIANRIGMPSTVTAVQIVRAAWEGGIQTFDTAHAYGRSEELLGFSLAELGISDKAKLISKFPIDQAIDSSALRQAVYASLKLLGVSCLEAMLFHRDNVIESWDSITDICERLRVEGLVRKFGVSTYEPKRGLAALGCHGLGALQVPGNLMDRRFDSAGIFDEAVARGMMIYLRSVFLQGLLLMDPDDLPARVAFTADAIRRTALLADEFGIARDELALCYVRDRWPQVAVLVGAESPEQVRRNVMLWRRPVLKPDMLAHIEKSVEKADERIIRPDQW